MPWNELLAYVIAYVMMIWPTGKLIGLITQRWQSELEESANERDSLSDAGRWIGILERILILTFVFLDQYGAIGFLIAAKGILRLSNAQTKYPRKQSEYVLIGTLLSFTSAILIGLFVQAILNGLEIKF